MLDFSNEKRAEENLEPMDEEEIESLKSEIWEIEGYKDEAENLEEKIAELKEELENI